MAEIHRCRECDQRKETRLVMRFGGGTYRRGGYWRRGSVCLECAEGLLQGVHDGQLQTNRWSVRGLRSAWKIGER